MGIDEFDCNFLLQEPENPTLDSVADRARQARQINVFAVGVGTAIDANQLRSLSGIRQSDGTFRRAEEVSWFRTPDFREIDNLVNGIVDQVCGAIPGSTLIPCMYTVFYIFTLNIKVCFSIGHGDNLLQRILSPSLLFPCTCAVAHKISLPS